MSPQLRDFGLSPGILPPGPLNAITDVDGVLVGHVTLIEGEDVRTGATAVLPHGGNLYQDKVPAGVVAGNGYGKLMGSTQIVELGEIETPVVLTNTLAVSTAAEAIVDWTLARPGNEAVRSVNPVVGETNDGRLNDIRRRALSAAQIRQAIETAQGGPVAEGNVGAGTGTVAFGWKGGIGTSSRRLPAGLGGCTVGVLVQANFGGVLQIMGAPVGIELGQYDLRDALARGGADGSIVMVLATDAPLSDRNLARLARRVLRTRSASQCRAGAHRRVDEQRLGGLCDRLFHVARRASHAGAAQQPVHVDRTAERADVAAVPGSHRGDGRSDRQRAVPGDDHARLPGRGGAGAADGTGVGHPAALWTPAKGWDERHR